MSSLRKQLCQFLIYNYRKNHLDTFLRHARGFHDGTRNVQLAARSIMSRHTCHSYSPQSVRIKLQKFYYCTSPPQHHNESVINRLRRIEKSLKFKGYSIIKIGASILLLSGAGVYLFRDHLRQNVAGEVSTVATLSLGDEKVKLKAEEVSKALLHAILNDASIQNEAVRFFKTLLLQPASRDAAVQLLINVLNDPVTQRKLVASLKQLISRSLSDPTFRHNLATNLKDLFDDPVTREGMTQLIIHILQDENIRTEASKFSQDVLASSEVTTEATNLARKALAGVVADESMRKKTGDGLWSAFTYSIKPSWPFGRGSEPSEK